jgi:hypothetical protein
MIAKDLAVIVLSKPFQEHQEEMSSIEPETTRSLLQIPKKLPHLSPMNDKEEAAYSLPTTITHNTYMRRKSNSEPS